MYKLELAVAVPERILRGEDAPENADTTAAYRIERRLIRLLGAFGWKQAAKDRSLWKSTGKAKILFSSGRPEIWKDEKAIKTLSVHMKSSRGFDNGPIRLSRMYINLQTGNDDIYWCQLVIYIGEDLHREYWFYESS